MTSFFPAEFIYLLTVYYTGALI